MGRPVLERRPAPAARPRPTFRPADRPPSAAAALLPVAGAELKMITALRQSTQPVTTTGGTLAQQVLAEVIASGPRRHETAVGRLPTDAPGARGIHAQGSAVS